MRGFKMFLESQHEFSSVQILMPKELARKILNWTENHVKGKDLAEDGVEDIPHVTVRYGLHTADIEKVKKIIKYLKPFEIELGKMTRFEKDDEDVLKLDITSPELVYLNKVLGTLPNTQNHSYKPHLTLAYIKTGRCPKLECKEFEGVKLTVKELEFSSKNGNKTKITI